MKNLQYTQGDKFKYSGVIFEITNVFEKKVLFKSVNNPKSVDSMGIIPFEHLFTTGKAEFFKVYGALPKVVSTDCTFVFAKEMMFYQYLPIKLRGYEDCYYEKRLRVFSYLINRIISDFRKTFGDNRFINSYVYLTVKRQYVSKEKSMNRPGYHSDGFLTEDINYIWSDRNPTIFNSTRFKLTPDDNISLTEMQQQALESNEHTFPNYSILRLDQYNIHKVNEDIKEGMRTFVKVSFSKDMYDLEGNSHNYELDYDWEMKPRKQERNIPQSFIL